MKILESVAYHRNGISGEGFYAVLFTDTDTGMEPNNRRRMLGVVFPKEVGKPKKYWHPVRVAVFDRDLVGESEIRFCYNSWRGDKYSDWLYAITAVESASWLTSAIKSGQTIKPAQQLKWVKELIHHGNVALREAS